MKRDSGFSLLAVIAIVAVIGLAGFIGWRVYDINQQSAKSNTSSSNASSTNTQNQNSQQPSQAAASTKTFKSSYLNFSFDYLADWTLDDQVAQQRNAETVTVTAPGTVESELPHSGYKYTEKGAIIHISAYALRDDGSYYFDDYYNKAMKDYITSSTFKLSNGTEAVRFKYSPEGPVSLYTIFMKDNIKIIVTLKAEGDIATSSYNQAYVQAYDNLINSIR